MIWKKLLKFKLWLYCGTWNCEQYKTVWENTQHTLKIPTNGHKCENSKVTMYHSISFHGLIKTFKNYRYCKKDFNKVPKQNQFGKFLVSLDNVNNDTLKKYVLGVAM